MPRSARIHAPGHIFHLISRFARDDWWLDQAGARNAYLRCLGRAAESGDAEILAYCLMSNHVHLVVAQGQSPLERLTKSVHTGFAAWVRLSQRKRRALGPVFAGRPRAILVDRDAYLLELVRYVHNNPVRAGVVTRAGKSRWSSHRCYIGETAAPDWLRMGFVLERFAKRASRARAKFDAFVLEGRKEDRRADLSGAADAREAAEARRQVGDGYRTSDGILGDKAFVARVLADSKAVDAALSTRGSELRRGATGRPPVQRLWEMVQLGLELDPMQVELRPRAKAHVHARRLLTWLWVREYAGKQIEVARLLNVSTPTVAEYMRYAVCHAADFDVQGSAIAALIPKARRSSTKKHARTPAREGAIRVRYHVAVDED